MSTDYEALEWPEVPTLAELGRSISELSAHPSSSSLRQQSLQSPPLISPFVPGPVLEVQKLHLTEGDNLAANEFLYFFQIITFIT